MSMSIEAAQTVEVDGLKIRYLRGGRGSSNGGGTPVVMTSPWPESLFALRRVWPALGEVAPLVALDLPGFGLSEGRADLMAPQAMGRFVPKILDALGLDRVHAVGPDVGTSALLFAAATEPRRFESLVVGSGAVDVELTAGPLKTNIHASSLAAFETIRGEDFAANAVDKLMVHKPEPEVLADFKRASGNKRFLAAMGYVRAYPRDLPRLNSLLPSIHTAVLSIWGARDPLVLPANAAVLDKRLPRTRSLVIDAGHFVWEDAPEAYAAAVRTWIQGGYRSA